jgi:hypothetical protein
MPLTVHPTRIQSLQVTCSVDSELDSLTVVFEDGKFWFRSTRRTPSGTSTDYVSVTMNPDEASAFADAFKTFVEQVRD